MHWRHHKQAYGPGGRRKGSTGAEILAHAQKRQRTDRATLELRLGTGALPKDVLGTAVYEKAWLYGQPILAMTTPGEGVMREIVDVWMTDEAVGAWRSIVLLDGTPPPRTRAKVYDTGDEENPYIILGIRLRLWNASQDLPKALVGATAEDPDGKDFLRRLVRRWTPIAQALVAETVKAAKRAVPETSDERYYKAALGEGQMIRLGTKGPVWVSADAAVHLAQIAGYPLGMPDEIEPDEGPQGDWILIEDVYGKEDADVLRSDVLKATKTVERIGYEAFANEIPAAVLKRAFSEYRWGRGGPMGERLRDDADARYERSLYHGHPVVIATARGRTVIWLSPIARAEYVSRRMAPAEEATVEASGHAVDAGAAPEPAARKRGRPRKAVVTDAPKAENAGASTTAAVEADAAPVAEPEPAVEPEPVRPPSLKKKQRRAIAKLARALARAQETGLSLVLDEGVLKAYPTEGEKRKPVAVSTTTPTIGNI